MTDLAVSQLRCLSRVPVKPCLLSCFLHEQNAQAGATVSSLVAIFQKMLGV